MKETIRRCDVCGESLGPDKGPPMFKFFDRRVSNGHEMVNEYVTMDLCLKHTVSWADRLAVAHIEEPTTPLADLAKDFIKRHKK